MGIYFGEHWDSTLKGGYHQPTTLELHLAEIKQNAL